MFQRNFALVLASNVAMGSAMPMLIVLGVLSGAHLAPSPALATLPPTVQMIGGIFAAAPLSLFMGRRGRRAGFLLGAGAMVAGGALGALALLQGSFAMLILAHVLLGGALVAVNFFRFLAAEVVAEAWKAHAVSVTLASGLFAALLGPALFTLARDGLAPVPFAGAYAVIAGLGLAGAALVSGMRGLAPMAARSGGGRGDVLAILRRPAVALAVVSAAASTALMVLMMVPTPLAMIGCGFGEDRAADVIRWHVVAMFAPGFFTGALLKRFGGPRVVAAGFALFALAALIALHDIRLGNFYVSLIVLGIAWNFGFVGGTYMLQTTLAEEERGPVQGINDTVIAIASALASLGSGVLYAGIGWAAIAIAVLPVALLLLLATGVRARAAPA